MKAIKLIGFILTMGYIILFPLNINGQYVIAGIHGSLYKDIAPDTLLNPSISIGSGIHDMYYEIDINQDSIYDIQLHATGHTSSGAYNWWVEITSLDSQISLSLGSIDSSYITSSQCGNYWVTRPILKLYRNNDTITNNMYVDSGFLGYRNNITFCHDVTSIEWINEGDAFFGYKFQTASDTLFGWVKINVTNYQTVLIKEFSLGPPLTNIREITNSFNIVTVYSNPASNKLYISTFNDKPVMVTINDISGRELICTGEREIDISNLCQGVYFVQVKTSTGLFTKKIIIKNLNQ